MMPSEKSSSCKLDLVGAMEFGTFKRSEEKVREPATGSEAERSEARKPPIGTSQAANEPATLVEKDEMRRIKCNAHTNIKRYIIYIGILGFGGFLIWQLHSLLSEEPRNYLGSAESDSILGRFRKYAVSTDAKPCSKVGRSLLAKGGSAVDAAIGTLLCMGVVLPNSLGLGGGCLMTLYDRKSRKAVVIDGRETAPSYASEDMFARNLQAASRGPLSVGVPGELAAYWMAHQMYSKLNWSQLFDESIRMARQGVLVVEHLANALHAPAHARYLSNSLAKLFTNPQADRYYLEGELLIQRELADTLERIRDHGVDEFYHGLTGQRLIEDLQAQGGKMSMADLANYTAVRREPLVFDLAPDLTLLTPPPPGSGVILSIILRAMAKLGYLRPSDRDNPRNDPQAAQLYYHRVAEAFKFAYAQRAQLEDKPDDELRMEKLMAKLLSDEYIDKMTSKIDGFAHHDDRYGGVQYFSDDHGTAHVSVLDGDGNAAVVTTSVNLYFGSGIWSPQTGIIFNDVMDDFVTSNLINKFGLFPSEFNRIRPGRRPISSMAPSVFTDQYGNARLILGSSGGTMITTSIALVSLRHLFIGDDIKTAIDAPRLHHQYLPDELKFESNFDKSILLSLAKRGHNIKPIAGRSSVCMAVASEFTPEGKVKSITANSDYRKGGGVDGY